jgi:hypothetical protein
LLVVEEVLLELVEDQERLAVRRGKLGVDRPLVENDDLCVRCDLAQAKGRLSLAFPAVPSASSTTSTSHTARPAMWRSLRKEPPPARASPRIKASGLINAADSSNLARHVSDVPPRP